MRYLTLLVVLLPLLVASPLAAQDDAGHMFEFVYRQPLPGHEANYSRFIQEFSIPYYDEMVKRTALVSSRTLNVWSGDGSYVHLFIREYASWDDMDETLSTEAMADLCQAAFGMTCDEKRAQFPPLVEMRNLVRRELLYSNR